MVRRKNLELAHLAETAAAEAEHLLDNAKRALRTARRKAAELAATAQGRGRRAAAWPAGPGGQRPHELLEATRRIAAQTRQRMAGTIPTGRPAG